LDQVECEGWEGSLLDCRRNSIGDEDCSHFEDAGLVCEGGEGGRDRPDGPMGDAERMFDDYFGFAIYGECDNGMCYGDNQCCADVYMSNVFDNDDQSFNRCIDQFTVDVNFEVQIGDFAVMMQCGDEWATNAKYIATSMMAIMLGLVAIAM